MAVTGLATAIAISALVFHPTGRLLVSGGYQEVLVWNIEGAELARRIGVGELTGQVRSMAWIKDGKQLVVADGTPGSAGHVRVIDFYSGKVVESFEPAKDEFISLAVSTDGKWIAAGNVDRTVSVWTPGHPKPIATLNDHSDWVGGVAFSPDGKLLASGSLDRTVTVWDTATWKPIIKLPQTVTEAVNAVSFHPDGSALYYAVGGTEERAVRVWRTENVSETEPAPGGKTRPRPNRSFTRPMDVGPGMPLAIGWVGGPRGPRMLIPCTDKFIKVLLPGGGVQARLTGHTDWALAAAAAPDGSRIATAGSDGVIKLWNGPDYALLASYVQTKPRTDEYEILTAKGVKDAEAVRKLLMPKPVPPPAGRKGE